MNKFRNKYRIESARAQFWNYGWDAAYYVTICTKNRDCFFGKIIDGEMILTEIGKIAQQVWKEIPEQFSFANIDEFVIMPNHVHGIIILETRFIASPSNEINISALSESNTSASCELNPPEPITSAPPGGCTGTKNPMIQNNISRIIRWYKGRATFESRKINPGFGWQSRFHDHIIRNEQEYKRIAEYIHSNPSNWEGDKFYLNELDYRHTGSSDRHQ